MSISLIAEGKRDLHRCFVRVTGRDGWLQSYQCFRKWTVEQDGIRYCTQHSPAKVEERRQQSQKEWEKQRGQWHRKDMEKVTCVGVPTENMSHGLLRKLIDFAYEMGNQELIDIIEAGTPGK